MNELLKAEGYGDAGREKVLMFMKDCVSPPPLAKGALATLPEGEIRNPPQSTAGLNALLQAEGKAGGVLLFYPAEGRFVTYQKEGFRSDGAWPREGLPSAAAIQSKRAGNHLRIFVIPASDAPGMVAGQSSAANASKKPKIAEGKANQEMLQQHPMKPLKIIRGPTQPFAQAKSGDKEIQIQVTKNSDGKLSARADVDS